MNRRDFFKVSTATAGVLAGGGARKASASMAPSPDAYGCLVDTTLCVGCRKCEQACNQRHGLPQPAESFEETSVLENERRMDETSYTVVNKYYPKNIGTLVWRQRPSFVKFQCMHCVQPSCVSACIVGALTKQENGAVIYDASKCIGCRYCMVACPFQVPAYEYHDPITPKVQKCTFCYEYLQDGDLPACAKVCPREAITFGKRSQLLELAGWKIKSNPGKYVSRVYGEKEVGGTSWLYLSSEPFEHVGFPVLSEKAPPKLTESIQHTILSYLALPIGLYAALGGIMWFTGFLKKNGDKSEKHDVESGGES